MPRAGTSWVMSDLLLLSGGIDSIAIAAWLRPAKCLTIDYGQKAATAEIVASEQACKALHLDHTVLTAPISDVGTGDMSDIRNAVSNRVRVRFGNSRFFKFRIK